MTFPTRRAALLLPVAVLVSEPPFARVQSRPTADNFAVERVAEGVYAVVRRDPPGLMFEANAAFVVQDDHVVVVDGGSNPESARAVLAALRRTTRKPVRYLVNTHWHGDHMMGNQVWADAFPGLEIVAHAAAREDFLGEGAVARRQFAEGAGQYASLLREKVAKGESVAGGPLSDEERLSHLTSVGLVDRALAQAGTARATPPTLTFDDRLVLARGGRAVELRWLGRAHTRGDVVVWLPAERLVLAGDLVAGPVPLVGSTSFPLDYPATLDRLLALGATTIVPGHGPVLRDDAYPRLLARMLRSLGEQTRAAAARGETLEEARRGVDLAEFRAAIAGDSPVRALLFSQYVAGPAVARAYWQARGEK